MPNLATRAAVYAAIDTERDYQDAMAGNSARETLDTNRDLGSMITLKDAPVCLGYLMYFDGKGVYDATYGWGVYVFSGDATATSAPTYYRADDDSGVWSKVL